MTQTPRQLDTTEDDVREEVAADYAPKMEPSCKYSVRAMDQALCESQAG